MARYVFKGRTLQRKIRTDTERTERPDGRGWSETYTPIYQDVTGNLELEVDWDGLLDLLGKRAVNNKRRSSGVLDGLIKCSFKEKAPK